MSLSALELRIYSDDNPLDAWDRTAAILAILEAAGELAPATIEARGRTHPYSRDEARAELARQDEEQSKKKRQKRTRKRDLFLGRREIGLSIHLSAWGTGDEPSSSLSLVVPFAWVADPAHGSERSAAVVALAERIAAIYPPAYGWAHLDGDVHLGGDPAFINPFAPKELHQIYWITLLGKSMVARLGRARVLATPAMRVTELPGGGASILTRPAAGDLLSDEARQAQARALVHLRPERDYDAVLAALRDRSAKLAPVEVPGHPDVAHLLARAIEYTPLDRRHARARELAALDTEPAEWRLAAAALPSDVDDPGAARARFSVDGERFVIGFAREIPASAAGPGLDDDSPECLPTVDLHFFREDYPGTRDRAQVEALLVPTLGAWLGQLLVRHLDGHWIPRRDLDEAQVIVGDRAWLPFLRVRRFLQSQEAVLRYSLTRFYREAARHHDALATP